MSAENIIQLKRPATWGIRQRVFCFPYAGAGASLYRDWEMLSHAGVQVCPVQLPGRESRRHEAAIENMDALADHLLDDMTGWLGQPEPFAFFGYSMGGILAYVLAGRLLERGMRPPSAVCVAACRPPQLLGRMPRLHGLGDTAFIEAVKDFGGLHETVLAEPELLAYVLPALRSDFGLLESYRYTEAPPLPIPLIVYGGTHDPIAARGELSQWRRHTSETFQLRLFQGGHFFLNAMRPQLWRTLVSDLGETRQANG
ncbi:thioesterase (plasmid) [Ralstonia pseudosolanacearum]|uniref:Thioesterase n=2 Tax=Ralstonia solanacearum species complex TaxID=3116862 RepID=A0AA92QDI3_RALSL|nr:alpha/beta fold hydrolase [Ralstonia pseudosolanacearum]QOK98954.1 thioesterase [Ralstonia pseudosolanacearum]